MDNAWSADLADMQSLSKYKYGVTFLLNVIDVSLASLCAQFLFAIERGKLSWKHWIR